MDFNVSCLPGKYRSDGASGLFLKNVLQRSEKCVGYIHGLAGFFSTLQRFIRLPLNSFLIRALAIRFEIDLRFI